MYQSFFAGICRSVRLTVLAIPFYVFRTRNVYVLVVFRRRLSVGSTYCSRYCDSYALLCFQNEECLRLCISRFIAGVYRSVRRTVLLPFVCLERGMYICQSSFKCIRRFDKLLIWNRRLGTNRSIRQSCTGSPLSLMRCNRPFSLVHFVFPIQIM